MACVARRAARRKRLFFCVVATPAQRKFARLRRGCGANEKLAFGILTALQSSLLIRRVRRGERKDDDAMTNYSSLIPVDSSAIRAIGYDGGTLTVEFHTGRVYDHPNVPYSVFVSFLRSSSKGAFYNQYIRGRYN